MSAEPWMLILNEHNEIVDLDQVSKNNEIYYAVLDFSKPKTPDYFFKPVVFIDTFTAPSAELKIGPYTTMIPFKWSIIVVYADQAELVPIEDIVSKSHDAFLINPITAYMPSRMSVRYRGTYETSWTYPTLAKTELLVIPVADQVDRDGESRRRGPLCIVAGERAKIPDAMDLSALW